MKIKLFGLGVIAALAVSVIVLVILDNQPEVTAIGELQSESTEVTPGKYELKLPFDVKNVGVTESVLEIRLEPGESGRVEMIVEEISEGNVKVRLAPGVVIR